MRHFSFLSLSSLRHFSFLSLSSIRLIRIQNNMRSLVRVARGCRSGELRESGKGMGTKVHPLARQQRRMCRTAERTNGWPTTQVFRLLGVKILKRNLIKENLFVKVFIRMDCKSRNESNESN